MNSFDKFSLDRLSGCHVALGLLAKRAVQFKNHRILCGIRTESEQRKAYQEGKTQRQFPNSAHNIYPGKEYSEAFDFIPTPFKGYPDKSKSDYGKRLAEWYMIGAVYKVLSDEMGIPIRWGGDWNNNWDIYDNNFDDLGHIEIILSAGGGL